MIGLARCVSDDVSISYVVHISILFSDGIKTDYAFQVSTMRFDLCFNQFDRHLVRRKLYANSHKRADQSH